jgi:hypothetical protein
LRQQFVLCSLLFVKQQYKVQFFQPKKIIKWMFFFLLLIGENMKTSLCASIIDINTGDWSCRSFTKHGQSGSSHMFTFSPMLLSCGAAQLCSSSLQGCWQKNVLALVWNLTDNQNNHFQTQSTSTHLLLW